MTAQDLMRFQLQHTAKMVDVVLNAFDDETQNAQSHDQAMNVRDMVIHMSDCYAAFVTEGSYAWGSFEPSGTAFASLREEMATLRASAYAKCETDDEATLKKAFDYLIHHDQYHLGQLVTVAISVKQDFDAHAMYA
jgi:uncharacterized damage-inducible protein DinB